MRWLISLVLALVMVTPAFAGEDPYIAIVGNDGLIATGATSAREGQKSWYLSPKYRQFMFDQESFDFLVPVCDGTFPGAYSGVGKETFGLGCEQFRSSNVQNQPEVCYYSATNQAPGIAEVWRNARVTAGNKGTYEWYIRLPKKPSGEINIVLQCGVLKPDAFTMYGYTAIEKCAAETGEKLGFGNCVRQEVDAGTNPLNVAALPKITAIAYPGPFNSFAPFTLTAFRNPGSYTFSGVMQNNEALQVLNGTDVGTRILLKACMDKTVIAKLPVTGQLNAANETEADLEQGDIIYVKLSVPRETTVDVYCHRQSLKVMGIGESPL